MKPLRTLLIGGISFFFAICSTYAETPVSGNVWGSWTPGGSPYLVQGDLLVPSDSILIIKPGVWVIFEEDYKFEVDGRVLALGVEDDSIYFTSNPGVTWSGFKYISNPDTSQFYYCLFEYADNYPGGYGGVFYMYISDIIVEHCTFQYNRANRGAAMYALWDYVSFRYNVCHDNEVYHCGGAINFGTDGNSIIERCVFYDNSASGNPGGAIYFWDNHSPVINCTIVQNSSPAVLSINGTTSPFVNCIFWDNEMGDVYEATYCDIQDGWPGVGNINEDPMFVDPGNDDFQLMANSPCIDAGDPISPLDPDGTIADMGAYYFDQIGWQPGELTLDLEPVNPPVIIPVEGGSFDLTLDISCDETGYAIFDFWLELLLPNGHTMGPLALRYDRFIAAGASYHFDLSFYVSAWAMPGEYEFIGYLGEHPDEIYATDSFEFEKEEFGGPVLDGVSAYGILSGWEEDEKIDLPAAEAKVSEYLLLSSYPNPFNPQTELSFNIPEAGQVSLVVYDVSGREVVRLYDGWYDAGVHEAVFGAAHLPSGIYFARLTAGDAQETQKLMLVK